MDLKDKPLASSRLQTKSVLPSNFFFQDQMDDKLTLKKSFLNKRFNYSYLKEYQSFVPEVLLDQILKNVKDDATCNLESFDFSTYGVLLVIDISEFSHFISKIENDSQVKKATQIFFHMIVNISHKYNGDVYKFCHDSIIIIWNLQSNEVPDHFKATTVNLATNCALFMMENINLYIRSVITTSQAPEMTGNSYFQDSFSESDSPLFRVGLSVGHIRSVSLDCSSNFKYFFPSGDTLDSAYFALRVANREELGLCVKAYNLLQISTTSPLKAVKRVVVPGKTDNIYLLQSIARDNDPLREYNNSFNHPCDDFNSFERHLYIPIIQLNVHSEGDQLLRAQEKALQMSVPIEIALEKNLKAYINETVLNSIDAFNSAFISSKNLKTLVCVRISSDLNCLDNLPIIQKISCYILSVVTLKGGELINIEYHDNKLIYMITFGKIDDTTIPQQSFSSRALELSLQLISALPDKVDEIQLNIHIGITEGEVYCETVGTTDRCGYLIYGPSVDIASSLMESCINHVDILLDSKTFSSVKDIHKFKPEFSIRLKHSDDRLVAAYRPLVICDEDGMYFPHDDDDDDDDGENRKAIISQSKNKPLFNDSFIARDEELKRMSNFIKEAISPHHTKENGSQQLVYPVPPVACILVGESSVGKTRLATESIGLFIEKMNQDCHLEKCKINFMYGKGIDEFNSDYGVIKDLLKQLIVCESGSLGLFEAVILTEIGTIEHYNLEIMKKIISMNSQLPACNSFRSQLKLKDRKLSNHTSGDSYSQYFDTAIKIWFATCLPHESLLYEFLELNNKESLITLPKELNFKDLEFISKYHLIDTLPLLSRLLTGDGETTAELPETSSSSIRFLVDYNNAPKRIQKFILSRLLAKIFLCSAKNTKCIMFLDTLEKVDGCSLSITETLIKSMRGGLLFATTQMAIDRSKNEDISLNSPCLLFKNNEVLEQPLERKNSNNVFLNILKSCRLEFVRPFSLTDIENFIRNDQAFLSATTSLNMEISELSALIFSKTKGKPFQVISMIRLLGNQLKTGHGLLSTNGVMYDYKTLFKSQIEIQLTIDHLSILKIASIIGSSFTLYQLFDILKVMKLPKLYTDLVGKLNQLILVSGILLEDKRLFRNKRNNIFIKKDICYHFIHPTIHLEIYYMNFEDKRKSYHAIVATVYEKTFSSMQLDLDSTLYTFYLLRTAYHYCNSNNLAKKIEYHLLLIEFYTSRQRYHDAGVNYEMLIKFVSGKSSNQLIQYSCKSFSSNKHNQVIRRRSKSFSFTRAANQDSASSIEFLSLRRIASPLKGKDLLYSSYQSSEQQQLCLTQKVNLTSLVQPLELRVTYQTSSVVITKFTLIRLLIEKALIYFRNGELVPSFNLLMVSFANIETSVFVSKPFPNFNGYQQLLALESLISRSQHGSTTTITLVNNNKRKLDVQKQVTTLNSISEDLVYLMYSRLLLLSIITSDFLSMKAVISLALNFVLESSSKNHYSLHPSAYQLLAVLNITLFSIVAEANSLNHTYLNRNHSANKRILSSVLQSILPFLGLQPPSDDDDDDDEQSSELLGYYLFSHDETQLRITGNINDILFVDLEKSIGLFKRLGFCFEEYTIRMYRAWLFFLSGNLEASTDEIERIKSFSMDNNQSHILSWCLELEIVIKTFALKFSAVRNTIKTYEYKNARKRCSLYGISIKAFAYYFQKEIPDSYQNSITICTKLARDSGWFPSTFTGATIIFLGLFASIHTLLSEETAVTIPDCMSKFDYLDELVSKAILKYSCLSKTNKSTYLGLYSLCVTLEMKYFNTLYANHLVKKGYKSIKGFILLRKVDNFLSNRFLGNEFLLASAFLHSERCNLCALLKRPNNFSPNKIGLNQDPEQSKSNVGHFLKQNKNNSFEISIGAFKKLGLIGCEESNCE